mgnify:FL=1
MSVKMVDVNQFVSNLSGGNKQKSFLQDGSEKILTLLYWTARHVVLISKLNRIFTS